MNRKLDRRVIYTAGIVAMLALTSGFALAAVLGSTSVNQSANFYQEGNSGANGYSGPALKVATIPIGTTVCSSSPVTQIVTGGVVNLILSSTTGGTVCTAGNFAEEFTVAFSATITTQSNAFSVTSQVGAGVVETNSVTLTLGTGISSAFTVTVNVYVDYGAVNPPAGGITVLDLVIQ